MFKKRDLMKKRLVLLCILPFAGRIMANDTLSHTFFSIQPLFHAALPTKISLFYERNLTREGGIKGSLQVVPFYSKSLNETGIAKFFLPFNKTSIVAGEFGSQAVLNNTVDIMANYFGVLTQPVDEVYAGEMGLQTANLTFQSLIRLRPIQTVGGLGFTYKQKISDFSNNDKGWFVQISTPIMNVSNDVGFSESIINEGGGQVPAGYVGTVGDALRGQTVFGDKKFENGKISDCALSRWGLGDIELSLGYETIYCDHFHGMWAGGPVIPTGNRPKNEYVFEPIVGNNGHFGLMLYGEYSYQVWENPCKDKSIWFHTNGFSQYLFGNRQRRSFDLLDKQWSRYMWVYRTDVSPMPVSPQYQTPGINVFTQDVQVWPRSSFNADNSFVYKMDTGFMAEAGYSTYYRQEEEVKLTCPWPNNVYIIGIDQTNTTLFATESNATMRRFLLDQGIDIDKHPNGPNVGQPNIINVKEDDLDLRSASHPCTISHALWGAMGYQWDDLCIPTHLSGGGSYEFSTENLALHRWTMWAKLILSF